MSRLFYLHLGPWNCRLESGSLWETRSPCPQKCSQVQSLSREILSVHNGKVHNFIQTKNQQPFTPVGRTPSQSCWKAVILAPLGHLLSVTPSGPNSKPPLPPWDSRDHQGAITALRSVFLLIFLKHREECPIFELLWRVSCLLLYFYHLSSAKQQSWVSSKHKLSISFWHVTYPSKTRELFSLTSLLWPTTFPLFRNHTPASAVPAPWDSAQPLLF